MRLTKILLLLFTVSLFSFTRATNSNKIIDGGPWKFIADKNVRFGVDHDVIAPGNIGDDFRQLRLKVTDGPLKIYSMKIYFDHSEQVQQVELRTIIPQGGQSRVIDLDGGLRHIKKIEFNYETAGYAKGRARVALWGRK